MKIGQQVICIKECDWMSSFMHHRYGPKKEEIVTITEIVPYPVPGPHYGEIFLAFAEYQEIHAGLPHIYHSIHFRELLDDSVISELMEEIREPQHA